MIAQVRARDLLTTPSVFNPDEATVMPHAVAKPTALFVGYSPVGPELALRDLPDFRLLPPSG